MRSHLILPQYTYNSITIITNIIRIKDKKCGRALTDADRLIIVDEKGNIIRSDILLAFFVLNIIKPNESVVFDVKCSKALDEIIPSDEGMGVSTEILIKASNLDLKIAEVPIKVSYEGETSTKDPISHGSSVIFSTIKFTSIHNPLKFYGIPGIIFLISGLIFIAWTIQIYSVEQEIITNIALIGIGGIVLGAVFLMTAVILFSIVTVVKDDNSKS